VAVGRVAAEALMLPDALPAAPEAAFDGIAVRAARLPGTLSLWGTLGRHERFDGPMAHDHAVRVALGGRVPEGADAVIPWNDVRFDGDRVHVYRAADPGSGIIAVGRDGAAGERIRARGQRVRASDALCLRRAGQRVVEVFQRPVVGLLGDPESPTLGLLASELAVAGASVEPDPEAPLVVGVGTAPPGEAVVEPVRLVAPHRVHLTRADDTTWLTLPEDPLAAWCGWRLLGWALVPPGCVDGADDPPAVRAELSVWPDDEARPSDGVCVLPVKLTARLEGPPLAEPIRRHGRPWSVLSRADGVVVAGPTLKAGDPVQLIRS
jgi:hypothetical protein